MLVADEALTNSVLAKKLNVSQAAITKAVKPLLSQGMLETYRDENDARVLYYRLTEIGKPIALEHQHHHQHTLHTYEDEMCIRDRRTSVRVESSHCDGNLPERDG